MYVWYAVFVKFVSNESIHIEGKKKSPQLSPGAVKKEVVGSKTYLEASEYAGLNSVIEASDVLPGIGYAAVKRHRYIELVGQSSSDQSLVATEVD